jgi:hypothetical protein
MTHTRVVCGLIGLAIFGIAGEGSAAAANDAWYRISEQVEGHPYAYWNMAWARFEWGPGEAKSPLLHPQGCNHATVGRVVFLPGPAKGQTISCTLPRGVSVFVPTSSGILIRTSKKDTKAVLRRGANSTYADTKVLDVSLDGQKINARQFKNTTGLFLLRLEKGSPESVRLHLRAESWDAADLEAELGAGDSDGERADDDRDDDGVDHEDREPARHPPGALALVRLLDERDQRREAHRDQGADIHQHQRFARGPEHGEEDRHAGDRQHRLNHAPAVVAIGEHGNAAVRRGTQR